MSKENKIIRKIVVGPNPKDGLFYIKDNKAFGDTLIIREIIESEPNVFDIYVEKEGGVILWKSFRDVPVSVDYDVDGY